MHTIQLSNESDLKTKIEAYIHNYQPADGTDPFQLIDFDAPKLSTAELIAKHGCFASLGVSHNEITEQAIEHYNQQFKVGAARCKNVFGDFQLRGIIMLLGEFTPMDCWVDAYFQARRFAGSQSLEGFFYSVEEISAAADDAFYSRLEDMANKKKELLLAGIIKQ